MRKINVKTHTRKLSSGKCTTVTHHQRHKPFHISYERSSFDEVESGKFDVFEELAELNQKDSKNFRQYMNKYGGIEQISDINHFNKYFKSFKSSIDSDNDGVIDRLDCKPFDKSMQGVKLPEIKNRNVDIIQKREIELELYNDENLYYRRLIPIKKNLINKIARGDYNPVKSEKGFQNIVNQFISGGLNKKEKRFGPVNKDTRWAIARHLRRIFEEQAKVGELDYLLTKIGKTRERLRTEAIPKLL